MTTTTVRLEGTSLEIGAGFYEQIASPHLSSVLGAMAMQFQGAACQRERIDFLVGFTAAMFGQIQATIGHDEALQLIDQLRGYAEKIKAENQAPAGGLH